MRTSLVCLACALLALTAGCTPEPKIQPPVDQVAAQVKGKDITVSVNLPRREWKVGETIPIEVTAVNTTNSPIEIVSPTGAPVLVRLMRTDRRSFEQVRVYPSSATSNILSWTLPAQGSRTFKLIVPVEPDWPAVEPLRISAELNGYPQYNPSVTITVQAK